jgi:hypothetical protein
MRSKEFLAELVRRCEYPHRVREMLAQILDNAPEDFAAFARDPRTPADDPLREWQDGTEVWLWRWQVSVCAYYLDWCRREGVEVGTKLNTFCTWYNRQQEERVILGMLHAAELAKGHPKAKALERANSRFQKLGVKGRKVQAELLAGKWHKRLHPKQLSRPLSEGGILALFHSNGAAGNRFRDAVERLRIGPPPATTDEETNL